MRILPLAACAALGLLVAGPLAAQTPAPSSTPAAPRAAPATAAPSATPAQAALIDINSASKEELDALPGIGAVRSAAIIKGRPYKGKDDLVHKKIIPENIYSGIKDRIIARQKS
jgi:DNA uptake protein ComE-like DNA-binding protein